MANNNNSYHIILPVLTVIVAVLVAIFAFLLPMDKLESVILISRFFEMMLPILAVGALIKYLFCWGPCKERVKEEIKEIKQVKE